MRLVGVRLADDRVQHRQRLSPGERRAEEAVLVVRRVTLKLHYTFYIYNVENMQVSSF